MFPLESVLVADFVTCGDKRMCHLTCESVARPFSSLPDVSWSFAGRMRDELAECKASRLV